MPLTSIIDLTLSESEASSTSDPEVIPPPAAFLPELSPAPVSMTKQGSKRSSPASESEVTRGGKVSRTETPIPISELDSKSNIMDEEDTQIPFQKITSSSATHIPTIQFESTKTNARVNADDTARTYIHDAFLADLHDANLTTENLKLLQVDVEWYKRKQEYKPDTVRNGDSSYLRTVQT